MEHKTYGPYITLIAQHSHSSWLIDRLKINSEYNTFVRVSNEQDILSTLNNTPFNLIIIDEAFNVSEIFLAIKMANNINYRTPIIALIDHGNAEQRKNMIAIGFDDCLIKPLSADNLEETISFWRGHDIPAMYLSSVQTLLDNCRNNRKLAMTLYEKLFAALPQHVDLIETAIISKDLKLALDTTHTLNGYVKTCYLQPIEEAADRLEKSFINNKPELIDNNFLILKQRISTFLENQQLIFDFLEK
jgi:CheY-like chemotaxis protein